MAYAACRLPYGHTMSPTDAPKVVPATLARWEDVRMVLDGSGEVGCWCQPWRGLDTKRLSGGKSRTELLREQMRGGPPPPGYLAYLGDEPVGWIGVGVRTEMPRLANSRTIPKIDDLPVWSIGCFRIRPGFRRQGVARALLAGVVERGSQGGCSRCRGVPDRSRRQARGRDARVRRIRIDVRGRGVRARYDH